MEPWRVVEIVLLSVTAGALLPAILQLRATLRTAQSRLDRTADRLDRTLDEVGVAAGRLNRATEALDDGRRVRELMDAIESLSRTVNQLRRSAQVATAIGAAVAPTIEAAVRAMRSPRPPAPEVASEPEAEPTGDRRARPAAAAPPEAA
jgi:hypothetical protein